jgi:hypothetical protein
MVAKINRDLKLKRKISVEVIIIAVEIHPFEEIRHQEERRPPERPPTFDTY